MRGEVIGVQGRGSIDRVVPLFRGQANNVSGSNQICDGAADHSSIVDTAKNPDALHRLRALLCA